MRFNFKKKPTEVLPTSNVEQTSTAAPQENWRSRLHTWTSDGLHLSQTRKAIVLDNLIESSSPGVDFFVLIILSCAIATFGLIVDSPAVIIGAMLVAPLMSPILGLSMASIMGLSRLFKRSLFAVLVGLAVAIFLSAIISLLVYRLPSSPLTPISNEILSRTNPSLIDLGIALAGGAAAAYALAHPRLSAALPGVAIATALMPPICTIGVGLAFLDPSIFLGAALLFATNLAAIAFAGIVTFAVLGFGPTSSSNKTAISRSLRLSAIFIFGISILLAVFAWNSVKEAHIYSITRAAIIESTSEMTQNRLVDLNIMADGEVKKISAVIRTSRDLSYNEVQSLQTIISERIGSPVSLEIITVPMQIIEVLNP